MNIPKQPTIPPIPTHKKATIAEPCTDCIKREDALMALTGEWTEPTDELIHRFIRRIKNLPPVTLAEKVGRWIPVKWHEITDEEREREGYSKDWVCYLDSEMPYDGQRILVTTKGGYVELDECYSDDGQTFSLDSGYDWVDDIIAWMPLPEPYKAESEDVPDNGTLYVCSCGYGWDKSKVVRHHFCPNCGAKVAEGNKE